MKYRTKLWYNDFRKAHCSSSRDDALIAHTEKAYLAYLEEYKKTFPCPPFFMETVDNLHDCDILFTKWSGDDFVVRTDHFLSSEDEFIELTFKNANIKKKDFDKQDVGWCYSELYPAKKGYELHVLIFEFGTSEMYDLIIECEDIKISNGRLYSPTVDGTV